MIIFGAAPNPCPTVNGEPELGFVYFTIENPAVVLAETVLDTEPSEFDEPAPFAFQFQETILALLAFVVPPLPKVNPSLSNEVNPSEAVPSASVLSDLKYFVAVLTES